MIKRFISLKNFITKYSLYIVLCLAGVWILNAYIALPQDSSGKKSFVSLFLTPDQQGQYFMKKQDYEKAAATYRNPVLKAAALYRDGQFKDAAFLFARDTAKASLFNKGTAFIMAGLYDDAIESFEKLLGTDPDFQPALINLEIAKKRKRLPPEDDHGGTGGMLEADEFVFNDRKMPPNKDETEDVEGPSEMSESEVRSLWLRRLESSPKDFLRVKFAYQHAKDKD